MRATRLADPMDRKLLEAVIHRQTAARSVWNVAAAIGESPTPSRT